MKSKTEKKNELDTRSAIRKAYISYVLKEGKNPPSIFQFATDLGIEEVEFYQHYSSMEAISIGIWKDLLNQTQSRLEESGDFQQFSVREKVLAFYYTLFEEMLKNRSFVIWSAKGWMNPIGKNPAREAVSAIYDPFIENLINEGFEKQELANRMVGIGPYKKAMNLLFWFLLDFWMKDSSSQFEDSDAAVEKAVNLTLDLMKENTLDKAIDFGKFLFGRFQMS